MPISAAAVREQVQRLLASPQLSHAEGLTKLFRFIVDETLRGRGAQLKETRLGLEVLARPAASYDSAIDPIVRVQMGRLRARLRNYYDRDGAEDTVLIEVPKGSYVPTFRHRRADPGARTSRVAGPTQRIAVLPFVNMSPEPRDDCFSDGLTEELINVLARDGQLQVVARTSSFQFKGQARDIREIGRQLEVGKVLEGSVRQSGTRVRITAQLINAIDGCHLWSERYEREITDIFAIHDEISLAIKQALKARLTEGTTERDGATRTRALDAYNHYLQGRFLWNKRTEQGLRAAIEHFQQAVQIDPRYARAHSGLADCHLMLGMSAAEAPARSMPLAGEAARRALECDDGLAEAHASLAAVRNCYEWNRPAAEAEYRRAKALDPNYATARHWNGLFNLATSGRLTEAIEELKRAIGLDPLSTPIIADLGLVHCFCDDDDSAVAELCNHALELEPHFHRPHWFLGLWLACRGKFAAAEAALTRGLERCPDHAFRSRLMGTLGYCYARWRKPRLAQAVRQQLADLAPTRYVARFDLAQIEAGRGHRDLALDHLEAAVAARESFAIFAGVWPAFRELRADARFRRIVAPLTDRKVTLP